MTTAAQPTELARIVQDAGLPIEKADALMKAFAPLVEQAGELVRASEKIKVSDASQLTEMKQARETRLKLVKVRTAADAARKELKADVLKIGSAIQAAYSWLEDRVKPAEAALQTAEDFAKNIELARKAQLKTARLLLLQPYGTDTTAYRLDEMAEAAFAELLAGIKATHKAKVEAEMKADEERVATMKKQREERERIAAENVRLRKEADDRERAAHVEREEARKNREAAEAEAAAERRRLQAIADQERQAREKIERDQRVAREAEQSRRAAEALAAQRAANAPDREKLLSLAECIRSTPMPSVDSDRGRKIKLSAMSKLCELCDWIDREANLI